MHVQTDHLGLNQAGAPFVAATVKRPVVTPARDGDRAQEDRRQQQENQSDQRDGKPVFRTLLTEATLAGLNAASSKQYKTLPPIAQVEQPEFVRKEKRPAVGPASISSDETTGLFNQLSAVRRDPETTQSRLQQPGQSSRAFIEAAARYAEQSFAASKVLASRGETLELQA